MLFAALDTWWYRARAPAVALGDDPSAAEVDDYLWNYTLGFEQYEWLRRTLNGSSAAHKVVLCHNLVGGAPDATTYIQRGGAEAAPYYEWGGRSGDGADAFAARRPGWAMPVHELLVATGVRAVLHGHDHVFDAEAYGGVRYVELPLVTDPERLHRSGDAATPTRAARWRATGFLRGRAEGGGAGGNLTSVVGLNATWRARQQRGALVARARRGVGGLAADTARARARTAIRDSGVYGGRSVRAAAPARRA